MTIPLSALLLFIIPIQRDWPNVADPREAIFYEVFYANQYLGGYFIRNIDLDFEYVIYDRRGFELPPTSRERVALEELERAAGY